jgi:dihydropteroate synthase
MTVAPVLRLCGRVLELGARPLLMGIVNATPDSFSDAGDHPTPDAQAAHGAALLEAGADLIDVGGETARGDVPAVAVAEEIARVVPLVERLAAAGALVSVDTYKPEVAEAAIAAGAVLVNDVSGLRDPRLADLCARTGAGLVLMHTRAAPKETVLDPARYEDVVADVAGFLH